MFSSRSSGTVLRALVLIVGAIAPLAAQQPAATRKQLSLEDALRLAESQSEAVQIARAGVTRATGTHYQARSQYLPQLNGTGSYTRTLRSQFSAFSSGASQPDTAHPAPPALCAPRIPPDATPEQRQAALNAAETCPSASGINFSKVGFGALNNWTFGLAFSQNIFSGGRVTGQNEAANAGLASARVELSAQRAQAVLDVTQAYYDAILADRLVTIAESTLVQTDEILRQTTVAQQVGNTSEFDLLRARVTRENQVPVLIQQRSNRDVAYLRLKQLLNVSLDDSIQLTTPLEANGAPVLPASFSTAAAAQADTFVSDRAPVRESEESVRAQQGLVKVARAERWPSLALVSSYQRLYFPTSIFPSLNSYLQNWTVGVSAGLPIFTGGRVTGDVLVAEGNLEQARAQLQQTRELAALDTRVALNTLAQAEAAFRASQGTAEQASRAYSIDQIRYREGISTQTDLAQSRLLLEQSQVNRAQAARDLAVARVRLALIRDLPLQTTGASTAAAAARATQQQQSITTQTQTPTQSTTSATSAGGATGAGTGASGTTGSSIP